MRFTNKDIVAQITYATLAGDIVLTSTYAHELPRYGLKGSLTNYAAAYCIGLLLALRHLKNFELDQEYIGNETICCFSLSNHCCIFRLANRRHLERTTILKKLKERGHSGLFWMWVW